MSEAKGIAEREAGRAASPSLADKVRFLSDPASYGGGAAKIVVRETHMSWVFLTDGEVLKLKKPVVHSFLDFSTLAAREAFCREEARLNRRLAPDVYLGVRTLTRDAAGSLALDGAGEVVDWLVHMRRLPDDRMLDAVIGRGALGTGEVDVLGDLLAGFYRQAPVADLSPDAYVERFWAQHAENLDVLRRSAVAFESASLDQAAAAIERVLERHGDLLRARVREGRVREGHGDLRPEHVCLVAPPAVIDCLEFNRLLRLVDPFDEIAFLGLECERLGAAWVGPRLRARLEDQLDDLVAGLVFDFYTASRACLRARLTLAHLLDPAPRTPERWAPLTRVYLDIAARAAARL
jgi:aminoglycoside phosphotransferase family enzyme